MQYLQLVGLFENYLQLNVCLGKIFIALRLLHTKIVIKEKRFFNYHVFILRNFLDELFLLIYNNQVTINMMVVALKLCDNAVDHERLIIAKNKKIKEQIE